MSLGIRMEGNMSSWCHCCICCKKVARPFRGEWRLWGIALMDQSWNSHNWHGDKCRTIGRENCCFDMEPQITYLPTYRPWSVLLGCFHIVLWYKMVERGGSCLKKDSRKKKQLKTISQHNKTHFYLERSKLFNLRKAGGTVSRSKYVLDLVFLLIGWENDTMPLIG